jgi:hypothetical protein
MEKFPCSATFSTAKGNDFVTKKLGWLATEFSSHQVNDAVFQHLLSDLGV